VEQTVRTVARDLQRGNYTRSAFQPDFDYSDGFRSFKGATKLGRAVWAKDVVKDSKVVSWQLGEQAGAGRSVKYGGG